MYRLKRVFLPTLFFALIFAVMPVIATQLSAPIRANSSALIGVGGEVGTVSDDGRYVVFESDSNTLVANDTNGTTDIFVYDRQTAQMTRVSVDSSGNQANNTSSLPSISADGRYVAFFSGATNLVTNDTNGEGDTFVHDRQTGQTTRVSVDSSGNQANNRSQYSQISGNGQFVMFDSYATNLVPNDTNNQPDIFVHNRTTGQTTRVSVDSAGNQHQYPIPDSFPTYANWISYDGRYVTFTSFADNLVAGNSGFIDDVFVHDRQTAQTTLVSMSSGGVAGNNSSSTGVITTNGRYVAFLSYADNLVADDTNGQVDVFLRDRQTNVTTRISLSSTGEQANNSALGVAFASEDGRYVFFQSYATNLTPSDTSGLTVGYIRDTQTNTTTRISVDSPNPEAAYIAVYDISLDMRYVSFVTSETLVSADTNNLADVYLLDRQTDTVTLISAAEGTLPPPAIPTLIAPTNGASTTNPSVTFSWGSVPNVTTYQIQIARDNGFTDLVNDQITASTSRTQVFTAVGTYYWRVRATNANGSSEWSATRSITLNSPNPPNLSSPSNGGSRYENSITFRWSAITGAINYRIQIATDSAMTTISYDQTVTTASYPQALPTGLYYWRVQVTTALGTSDWSSIWSVTLLPPLLPNIHSERPYNNSEVIGNTVNFTWGESAGATQYQIQIFSIDNNTTPIYDEIVNTNSHTQIVTTPTNTFRWRVKALSADSYSNWTSSIFVVILPEIPPTLLLPAADAVTTVPYITFTWATVGRMGTWHQMQVATDSEFTNIVKNETLSNSGGANTATTASLIPNVYYWRVRMVTANGNGEWSEISQFTLLPYAAPTLISPINNVTITTTSVSLRWELPSAVYGISYQYQVATDGAFTNIIEDRIVSSTINASIGNLPMNSTYYWRVRALSPTPPSPITNLGDWSEVGQFTTAPHPAPVLTAPSNGATVTALETLLSWNVEHSGTYQLSYMQIASDSDFTNIIVHHYLITNSYTLRPRVDMPYGTYYWRVRQETTMPEILNIGEWSETRSFTLETFDAPTLVLPADGAVLAHDLFRFKWEKQIAYRIEFATDSAFTNIQYIIRGSSSEVGFAIRPIGNPLSFGTYYWRVRHELQAGGVGVNIGEWSEIRQVVLQPPTILRSPVNNIVTNQTNLTFTWDAVPNDTSYALYFSLSPNMSPLTKIEYATGNTFNYTFPVPTVATTYYWVVVPATYNWSEASQFTIVPPNYIGPEVMNEQQLFTMAQPRLTDGMTFALFDITPTGIITTVQFNDGGVVTGTVKLSVTNGLMTIMVEGVSGGSAEQQTAMYDVVPSLIMAMFDETLPDDYVLIESLTLTDVGISANLLMPNNP